MVNVQAPGVENELGNPGFWMKVTFWFTVPPQISTLYKKEIIITGLFNSSSNHILHNHTTNSKT